MALNAEMGSVLRELTTLQAKAPHRLGLAGAATSVRAMLLLYKPKGFLAWMLHLAFFAYLAVLAFCFIAVMVDPTSSPFVGSKNTGEFLGALMAYTFMLCLAGVPLMILRYFAAKIHRRQCAQAAQAPQATTVPGAVQA
jgi:hypothetical protein